ncbi:MAG: PAS domain S-box protein [Thermoanaerobaculaceae bacterium]|jgi:PAS domain S-box-containing protein|nr:PAS domain S-box protein [Thermoanaerobaculaceae bacterium]
MARTRGPAAPRGGQRVEGPRSSGLQRSAHNETGRALRDNEERYRTLFERMTEGFALHEIIVDDHGVPYDYRFLELNPAFERLTGLERVAVLGKTVREVLPGIEPRWIETYGTVALSGQPVQIEEHAAALGKTYEVRAYSPRHGQFAVLFTDITERKRSEVELREGREDLNHAQAVAQSGSWRLDVRRNALHWSDQTYRIFGIPMGTPLTYELFLATIHPDDRAFVDREWTAAMHGKPYDIEHRIVVDGAVRWVCERAELEFDELGTLLGGFGTVQDVTERRLAREKETWLASFPQQNPNPVVEVDLTARAVSYANPAAVAHFPEVATTGLDHPWLAGIEAIAEDLTATGGTSTWREIQTGDSWCRQSFSLPRPGRFLRIYGIDVTDRVHAQAAAEQSRVEAINEKNRLEAVMEALPVGVAIVDSLGGSVRFNRAYDAIWRGPRPSPRSIEDYKSYKAWWTDTGQPVRPEEWASARAVQRGETVVGQVMEIECFDGSRAFVHNSAAPYLDADGKVAGSAVAIVDVTELRRKEQELERLNERLVQAQRSAGAGMWEWDLATQHLEWSPELYRLFGLDPAAVTATFETWREVLHPADRQAAGDHIDQALRDRLPLQNEYRIVLPDGEVRWVSALGNTTYDQSGTAQRMAGFCIDITERKQAEARIRAALKEKEVLLKEIHHRVKNNLQIVASMLNLQLSVVTDEAARGPLIDSQNRVRTLALIHEKLYGSKNFAAIPLNDYVAELASIVHRSFASTSRFIRLELDVEEVELEIGTAIPVGLILNELLANAFKHAFPDDREGRIVVGLHRLGDCRYELSVRDDGIGFPDDLDYHNSATLGLQLVSDLAAQLRATLALHRDGGTCFVLSFRERT